MSRPRTRPARGRAAAPTAMLAAALAVPACSPPFDWRVVQAGDSLTMLFPCRVERRSRPSVPLADVRVPMTQLACTAQGMTFAATLATVPEGRDPGPLLQAWSSAVAGNLGAPGQALPPVALRGAAQSAAHLLVQGRTPEGARVDHEMLHFASGSLAVQVSVVGPSLRRDAVDTFFEGIELKRR